MDWEKIRREFETTDVSLKTLAEKYGVKESTMRSRKNREKWQRNDNATQRKNVATRKNVSGKRKAQREMKNRSGNPNPKNQFAERNQAAFKHGLFSRYIPKETLEIMGMLEEASPVDLLWSQIQIQYAAIIRAQEIMFVQDQDDTTRVVKKRATADGLDSTEWETQFAWDKHATFLNAQSRAITELRTSLRQFDEMAHIDDERRLKLEGMRLGIEKTRAEVEKIKSSDDDKPIEITIKRKT